VEELTGTEQLVLAILDHRVVHFRYQDRDRVVEPHLLGLHEAGEPMLVAYQTGGTSQSAEVPGWRTFITTAIEDVEVAEEQFQSRGELNALAHPMLEIFARASLSS
jgi:predicted DNA-binding transcriptional regulator YafY